MLFNIYYTPYPTLVGLHWYIVVVVVFNIYYNSKYIKNANHLRHEKKWVGTW